MSDIGHNSHAIAVDQLRRFVERIERLSEKRKGIGDDIRDVLAEAKANGFDTKAIRHVVKQRAMDKHVREEREAVNATYCEALGLA